MMFLLMTTGLGKSYSFGLLCESLREHFSNVCVYFFPVWFNLKMGFDCINS